MRTNYNLYEYEDSLHKEGYKYIGGTDEAGRGPLFGPVVAACCILPNDFKREKYFDYIKENALAYGIGIVDHKEIDRINIYAASKKAMMMAIEEASKKIKPDYVLTDAMPLELDIPVLPIIKGDAKSISIAAASVLAKVTRDRMMYEIDKKYPEYGFANHKGYPTKKHIEAIHKYGLIDGYRLTYGPVKEIVNNII